MMLPRGVRNNNPLNIRRSYSRWVGLRGVQDDPEYCQFETMEYGIRAAALILLRYQKHYGLKTIKEIITRWAPPNENDTEGYIRFVARYCRVRPDEPIDLTDFLTMKKLIAAMAIMETGQRLDSAVIERGLRLAGIEPKKPTTVREVVQTDTVKGTAVATATTAATAAVTTALPHVAGLDWRVALVVILLIAVLSIVGVAFWRAHRE